MSVPVVAAWTELVPARAEPEAITVLKGSRSTKRTIYRLQGVGDGGTDVIAKRCLKATARIERVVYEQVLPRLPLTTPRYYGCVEGEGEFDWLFLEDVGSERFSPLSPDHRRLAAAWLSTLHLGAAHLAAAASLPDRRPRSYLERLRTARAAIERSLPASTLGAGARRLLESVARQCDAIERLWDEVEQRCAGMPLTLVHADFRPKNVRVRGGTGRTLLYPLDWETAGWGVPAVDLAPSRSGDPAHAIDLDAYASAVCPVWPDLDRGAVGAMEELGRLFRKLDAVGWAAAVLDHCPEKSLIWLQAYEPGLEAVIRGLGGARGTGP